MATVPWRRQVAYLQISINSIQLLWKRVIDNEYFNRIEGPKRIWRDTDEPHTMHQTTGKGGT